MLRPRHVTNPELAYDTNFDIAAAIVEAKFIYRIIFTFKLRIMPWP